MSGVRSDRIYMRTGSTDALFAAGHLIQWLQVRDLQWKTFLTVSMYMSGWAPHDKQPWAFGEPYTSYNRKWLRLKSRLTPYLLLGGGFTRSVTVQFRFCSTLPTCERFMFHGYGIPTVSSVMLYSSLILHGGSAG